MPGLHPEVEPYRVHRLPVEPPHVLHVEECGRPDGLPALFLHGGPGAGCEPVHRRFFDPSRYRAVLFDQRGCGRSRPHAALEGNTTWALVEDIERIRAHLGIERWLVFGGSWGSTLALAYAEAHPERVLALVLRGIFLCRERDIRWFYQSGADRIHPEHWREFVSFIPETERGDLVRAYHRRLTADDAALRLEAARRWALWEARCATLRPDPGLEAHFAEPEHALALARIECHYFVHGAFLAPNQLLREAHRLHGIPGVIVHGRYDVVCPVEQAFALHEAWPGAELVVVPDAGHAASEPGIAAALVAATDRLADRLS